MYFDNCCSPEMSIYSPFLSLSIHKPKTPKYAIRTGDFFLKYKTGDDQPVKEKLNFEICLFSAEYKC